ncbi:MAG: NAD-dependent epimerase/dehydratase family protein [Bacteroidetes bacterium]|nr:NAD-dependent epimerase/dehydratase family protein [Bacteroidota bacterium]
MSEKILIIGASGQIGIELSERLRAQWGNDLVVAADVKPESEVDSSLLNGPYEVLNTLDKEALFSVVKKYQITQIYQLAALLSATAEKNPAFAWELNMNGLFYILDLAKEKHINKIYWPSSIAVFGPSTPKWNTPQDTVMDPNTVYGISKLSGERWCDYYHQKYQVDVRSIRYPGLIGYKSAPGGGTTDYAVDVFYKALQDGHYTCFLAADTALPMMMMSDAIQATVQLMEAEASRLTVRGAYNLAGMTFTPAELTAEIQKYIPGFVTHYAPDFRQVIANSWPSSIDDAIAQRDWDWKAEYDIPKLVSKMLEEIKLKIE